MNEILKQAEKIGKLTWFHKQIRSCNFCDKKSDYHRYPRSGRYHSKGDKNFDKPVYYSGIKFNEGFVTIQGHGDMCLECCVKHNVKQRLIDYIIEHDLKIEVMKNDYKPGKYLKDDIRICFECEEEILESQMTKDMALMGNGYYPSGCPKCGAKSLPFGRSHKTTSKFGYIVNPESLDEVRKIKSLVDKYNEDKEKDDKLAFYQSNKFNTSFYVEETRWTNGHREVIQFGTGSKQFTVGYFYKDKCNEFKKVLFDYGYIENKK